MVDILKKARKYLIAEVSKFSKEPYVIRKSIPQCCDLNGERVKPRGCKILPRPFFINGPNLMKRFPCTVLNILFAVSSGKSSRGLESGKRNLQFSKCCAVNFSSDSKYTYNNTRKEGPIFKKSPAQLPPIMNLAENKTFQELYIPELQRIVSAFLDDGYEIRMVGGAVRDIIRSMHLPKDVDLATTATPDEMIGIFKKNNIRYIETGLQHGTLTAHLNRHDFEITTLRIDKEHDGRRAKVEFTNDWKLDAERRDLTFNAMSLDFDGNLYDYFSGLKDLAAKKVRFVGDPEKRIKEDFLRILRYFRFYGRISDAPDDHDPDTLEIIRKCAHGLKNVAVERVWLEVSRILVGNHAPSLLKYMYKLGVAENIGFPTCTDKHLEELESVWSKGQTHALEPVSILMSLVDTADEADDLAVSLKLSSAERNLGKFIASHRNLEHANDPKKPYQDILASNSNSKMIDKIRKHIDQVLRYKGLFDIAREIEDWQIPCFPVTGNDLKKAGVKAGPMFGKVIHEMKNIWMESYYTLGKEELVEKLDQIVENIHK